MNELITKVFVEQPLALHGSAKHTFLLGVCCFAFSSPKFAQILKQFAQ